MNLNHLFDVRLAETDLMICETDSKGRDNPQLQRIMQVIMKDDAYDGYTTRISDFDV